MPRPLSGYHLASHQGQPWQPLSTPEQLPISSPVVALFPTPSSFASPTLVPTPTPTPGLAQRIDTYIDHLTQTQQIGQLLMLPVYSTGYTAALSQPLQEWEITNVILKAVGLDEDSSLSLSSS